MGRVMGAPYINLDSIYHKLDWTDPNSLILEIGSDRDEGSTKFLNDIAQKVNSKFITVDVVDYARQNLSDSNIEFVIYDSGSDWCKNYLAQSEYTIKILYLDNFDWIWHPDQTLPEYIKQQIEEYNTRGVEMNNINSVQEHFAQLLHCYPKLNAQSLIVMDDTWLVPEHDVYIGKCGPIVHYLLLLGWRILHDTKGGIIMGRSI